MLSIRQKQMANLLGVGLSFPLQQSETGGILLVRGEDLVKQSIREILLTDAGEGVRAFDIRRGVLYGTRLRRYHFETMQVYRELADYEVKRVLDVWEPRILVTEVQVTAPAHMTDIQGRRTVLIDVRYVLRATNRSDNAVVAVPTRV